MCIRRRSTTATPTAATRATAATRRSAFYCTRQRPMRRRWREGVQNGRRHVRRVPGGHRLHAKPRNRSATYRRGCASAARPTPNVLEGAQSRHLHVPPGRPLRDRRRDDLREELDRLHDGDRPTGGTTARPYCLSQDGVNAVVRWRSLIVMRGPDAYGIFGHDLHGRADLGRRARAAAIMRRVLGSSGFGSLAGNVYVRRIEDVWVVPTRRHRCRRTVRRFTWMVAASRTTANGGIRVDGASFDITNTVIAGMRGTSIQGGGCGRCLGTPPGSQPARFATPRFLNNTVVSNIGTGNRLQQ